MTGFGRAEVSLPSAGRAVVEVRTLNHRYLEVEARLPEGLQAFEDAVRAMVGEAIRRGQVRVSVAVRSEESAVRVAFQPSVARRYAAQLRRLRQKAGLSGEVTLQTVLSLPQVVVPADRGEARVARTWPYVRRGVSQALSSAVKMRRQEGRRLGKVLEGILRTFTGVTQKIRQRMPVVQQELQKRLAERIATALKNSGAPVEPDPAVILAETAGFVQGTDVSEELARVSSHLEALREAARGETAGLSGQGGKGSPGRTIDFLAQELQREVNTLGTKLRDAQVIRWVVLLKGEIEKLREQAANIE